MNTPEHAPLSGKTVNKSKDEILRVIAFPDIYLEPDFNARENTQSKPSSKHFLLKQNTLTGLTNRSLRDLH